jgi:hypothetical protein
MKDFAGRARALLLPALLPLALAACAPDAWNASDPYGDFLTQVRDKCWKTQLGRTDIPQLMPMPNQVDDYFMDLTSRFYYGKISEQSYLSALEGFYDARPDSTGVRCILAQMPARAPSLALPPSVPPVIIPPPPGQQ